MTRYEIRCREPHTAAAVGWDDPLATYFAQVWDERTAEFGGPDDEELLLWAGCYAGEIRTVERLARVLAPYATLPDDVRDRLTGDRTERR